MLGTDQTSGKPLSGIAHLRQSITDILTTPLGSRVCRRTYGSRLFELIDAPLNAATLVDMYQATAEAIIAWEPRLQVTQVKVNSIKPGQLAIDLIGKYLPNGQAITLPGIIISGDQPTVFSGPNMFSSGFSSGFF